MGGLLKPVKKLWKNKTARKIAIGVALAAATYFTAGAIMAAAGPAVAGGGGAVVGTGAGAGAAGAGAAGAGAAGSGLAAGAGAGAGAGATAAGTGAAAGGAGAAGAGAGAAGAGAGAAGGSSLGSSAIPSTFGQGLSAGIGSAPGPSLSASMLPTTQTPTAVPLTNMTGAGLGQGPSGIYATGNVLQNAAAASGNLPSVTTGALNAAGAGVPAAATRTAPLTQPTPQTPAEAARRDPNISPLVPGGQPAAMFQNPTFQAPEERGPPQFANLSSEGYPIDIARGGSGGLMQTAMGVAQTAGDWWNRLPSITQYSLLRFGEGALAGTPRNAVDEQIRLEDRRRARNRAPTYSGGGFF